MLDLMDKVRHWRLEQDGEGILWLTLDRAESAVNALSALVPMKNTWADTWTTY